MTPRPSMSAQSTPAELLQTALAADGARPFVTFYDDASGERVELSVATFENWVAKTANLLQDVLTAEPLTGWDGLLAGLLLPLVSGGSVVLCRNLDPAALAARVNSERVTGVIEATPRGGLNV